MKKELKKLFFKIVALKFKYGYTNNHKKELKKFCNAANLNLKPQNGEDAFIAKWKKLYPNLNIDFYRFYSQFIGNDPNIVSDDIFHIIIEPILNNQQALSVYSDKNMYEKLLTPHLFPVCIIRNMNYDYLDKYYQRIDMNNEVFDKLVLENPKLEEKGRLIVKPTTDTCAGAGVRLFIRKSKGLWVSNDNNQLSLDYLNKEYKRDFILQECIETSDFIKQFNPTSYSTLRIITYRSVKDDKPHIIGMYMRVGAKGSFKDNVWGGGYACCINDDGTLAEFASDASRKKYNNINGISLTKNKFVIPNFDKVESLVLNTAKEITPNRLLSFDIILNQMNLPHIIEFNIKHQTVTTIQTMKKSYFGEFTDEVIDYCMNHMDKICYQMTIRES